MIPEIAAMLDQEGGTTTLTGPGEVIVYSKVQSSWEPVRKLPFSLDPNQGLAQLRLKMGELVAFFGDCRIFVTKAASGAIFFELEKVRCTVWEISGRPEEFLEQVWKEEEQDSVPQSGTVDIPVPVEIAPGKYYLSIKEIQGKRPEVSSKQVLQKFIKTGVYQQLEVICDHIPPWIALESTCCGFTMQSERLEPDEVKLVLTKNSAESSGSA
ncbi:MAG: nitrogenase [Methanospirillum sp.]|uniref:Fe-only nitrogenase accessory AnfO family protein n=1 Tax=Methanospirillum sp. TaxID=45200 RepID=UPI002373F775|nr:Fe-only nitrogenase accessory AnfO family protein [Methanospirillum sp.]MDD1727900.1 nitrogenase [Methanospirillum sp.]